MPAPRLWFAVLRGREAVDDPARSIQPNFRRRIGGRNNRKPRTFALSVAGGEIRDEGRAKLKSTSDCVSSRPPIAGAFRSDLEMIASNFSRI
jgi:hypothetical protein